MAWVGRICAEGFAAAGAATGGVTAVGGAAADCCWTGAGAAATGAAGFGSATARGIAFGSGTPVGDRLATRGTEAGGRGTPLKAVTGGGAIGPGAP